MWESKTIVLTCGCDGSGAWDDLWVGMPQTCTKHGEVEVLKFSRIFEPKTSKDFQLDIVTAEGATVFTTESNASSEEVHDNALD